MPPYSPFKEENKELSFEYLKHDSTEVKELWSKEEKNNLLEH